jgi:hypothetical protein
VFSNWFPACYTYLMLASASSFHALSSFWDVSRSVMKAA